MDPGSLVEGGWEGLVRIANAFRSSGLPLTGIYLIKRSLPDGDEEWVIPLVSDEKDPALARRMVDELIRLRRDQALPWIDPAVRIKIANSDDPEVSRVIGLAQRLGEPPIMIRDTMWDGLFIEYAMVALVPERAVAAA